MYIQVLVKLRHFYFSIWCSADKKIIPDQEFTEWGWKEEQDGTFSPHWMTLEEASNACQELIKCSCQKSCHKRCRCKLSDMPCTELCRCNGGCD